MGRWDIPIQCPKRHSRVEPKINITGGIFMNKQSKKEFDFQKKVSDTLFDYDVMQFIDAAFDDEMRLDKDKSKKFLEEAKEALENLIEEADQL